MNIKMFGLKDLVNFASASGDGKIIVFTPQVPTHAHAKYKSFTKNGDNLVG